MGGFVLWEKSLQWLMPWLVLETVTPGTEYAQGLSVVEMKLKFFISRMRAGSGRGMGAGGRGKESGGAGRKVGWGESHVLLCCCMGYRREDSDYLHIVTLHCWGSQMGFTSLQHWQT